MFLKLLEIWQNIAESGWASLALFLTVSGGVYCRPVACTDFLKGRGEKKGTLVRVLASKMTVYHVYPAKGAVKCFANQEGTFARFFGSQDGT